MDYSKSCLGIQANLCFSFCTVDGTIVPTTVREFAWDLYMGHLVGTVSTTLLQMQSTSDRAKNRVAQPFIISTNSGVNLFATFLPHVVKPKIFIPFC